MENLSWAKISGGFRVEGFPDAVKLVKLDDKVAKNLSDLALHRTDLIFAKQCLESINKTPVEPSILRRSLWLSAVVSFCKCFGGNNSRGSLKFKNIYGSDTGAGDAYSYIDSLRNKHLVHDENSYAQCYVGAVVNRQGHSSKVPKIVMSIFHCETLEQGNYSNMSLLIDKALTWVEDQIDEKSDYVVSVLENKTHDELMLMDDVKYRYPDVDDIGRKR